MVAVQVLFSLRADGNHYREGVDRALALLPSDVRVERAKTLDARAERITVHGGDDIGEVFQDALSTVFPAAHFEILPEYEPVTLISDV